jgi:hypothetical protein
MISFEDWSTGRVVGFLWIVEVRDDKLASAVKP